MSNVGMYIVRVVVEHEFLYSLIDFQEHRKVWQNILKGNIHNNHVRAASVHSSKVISNIPSPQTLIYYEVLQMGCMNESPRHEEWF